MANILNIECLTIHDMKTGDVKYAYAMASDCYWKDAHIGFPCNDIATFKKTWPSKVHLISAALLDGRFANETYQDIIVTGYPD
jgi:hypothetical protein